MLVLTLAFGPLCSEDYPDLTNWSNVNTLPKTLYLYIKPRCPYCIRVMDFLSHTHIPVVYRDITQDAQALSELLEHGGKRQVPCLFIDGEPLYESLDIIAWLKDYQKSN